MIVWAPVTRFAGRLAFVEDYDMNVARHLVQGVNVWLNTPLRPLEASGTSGQKVAMNGGLNLSSLWVTAAIGTAVAVGMHLMSFVFRQTGPDERQNTQPKSGETRRALQKS